MPYSVDLDKCIFSKSWENEWVRLVVSVYSYNRGPKKLQIARENKDNQGNFRFAKLGRITKDEIEGILPLIKEAVGHLD